jgi:hypothetical protein
VSPFTQSPKRVSSTLDAIKFRLRWGFPPPPPWSDWVGYEVLLSEIEGHGADSVPGDVLEIGALLGGGTAKLCQWFARHAPDKRVISIDVFDPSFDPSVTCEGWPMTDLYRRSLENRDQRSIFDEVTRDCTNLTVVAGDSTEVDVPTDQLAFAFVDGSHVPSVVRSDFELVWGLLAPGGIVAFHDYGGDLPGVTHALHACIGEHGAEIGRVWVRPPTVLFIQREATATPQNLPVQQPRAADRRTAAEGCPS